MTIQSGGDKPKLPRAITCSNTISLLSYENETELIEKLLKAIDYWNTSENI